MLRDAAQKEALGHGVGFLRRELVGIWPFFLTSQTWSEQLPLAMLLWL